MKTPSPPAAAAPLSAEVLARELDQAAAHFAAGRMDAAAQIYRRLERAVPADVRPLYSLAVIDLQRGRLEAARQRLTRAVALAPALFPAWHNLGMVCQQLNAWPDAADAYGHAVALQPDATESRRALAVALAIVGRVPEAIAHHRRLAEAPALRWPALTRIALLDLRAISDADLAQMQQASADGGLDGETRIGLLFAAGEALDARGRAEEAFDAFAAGNRLKRATLTGAHAPAAVAQANAAAAEHIRHTFTPAFLAANAPAAPRGPAPIFVVGMPRSGSTLIEQILASHPAVQGLGETAALPDLAADGAPQTPGAVRALRTRYLEAMRARGWDGRRRFVDKTLENYLHVGLIHLMFPEAAILHSLRDPMDVCLSCYRQLFVSGNETLYDLTDIGDEYGRYRSLMAHWDAVLPGRVLDVAYEPLVQDPARGLPALVSAAGLPWDEACARFFEREGAVRTASVAQVRRPIHGGAVGRWRPLAARLAPLVAALGPYAPNLSPTD